MTKLDFFLYKLSNYQTWQTCTHAWSSVVDPQYYTIYASKEILVASLHNTGSHTYAYIVYILAILPILISQKLHECQVYIAGLSCPKCRLTAAPRSHTSVAWRHTMKPRTNKPITIKVDRLCQTNAIGKIRHSLINSLVIAHVIVRYMLLCLVYLKSKSTCSLSHDCVICSCLYPKWIGKIENSLNKFID